MVTITIDGRELQVEPGITILTAARNAGIDIPTLCDHPHLVPYGGCRLCAVEVEGARVLQTACTMPVSDKMVVHTQTDKVKEARKFILTMIFSERNHFCPFCQVSGGDCELQNAAYAEGMTHWPLQPNWQSYAVDASHPYIIIDHNRCILCRRCVRACSDLVGNYTLGFEERGAKSVLVADLGVPLGESTCISCGTCAQVCPTGAIIDRESAYKGKETQVDRTKSICIGCSVGCGIEVLSRDNRLVRIDGDWDAPVNEGLLCKVGRYEPMYEKRTRIVTPLIKDGDKQKVTTWSDALAFVGEHLKPMLGKDGSEVAGIASTRLSAEALYNFKHLVSDAMHSALVTTTEEGGATAAPRLLAKEKQIAFENRISDLNKADTFVVLGADLVKYHEVLGFMVKRAAAKESKLLVIDSEDNPLFLFADKALLVKPGTEHLAFAAAVELAKGGSVQLPADCMITMEDLKAFADFLAASKETQVIFGKDYSKSLSGDAVKSLAENAEKLGTAKVLGTKGKANSMTASLLDLDQPFELKGNEVVIVALADDDLSNKQLQKLEKAGSLIVLASYRSALTAKADVVLPVAIWSEDGGTYINLEGKVQKTKAVIKPADEVHTSEFALRMIADQVGVATSTDEWITRLTPDCSVALTGL